MQNGALRNSSINWIFLWRLPMQNHLKLCITKTRNKAKYLTRNSIWFKFVKKTSMPNPVKSLGCIKCSSSSSPWFVKNPSKSIRYNCQKICSWPITILEIRKKVTFLLVINNPTIQKFFKDFTNHRKKTNRMVIFSSRTFLKIPKYRDHQWDLPKIWITRFFQTYWRVQLVFMKVHPHSSLEPPLEYKQNQMYLMIQCLLWPFLPSWELQKYYAV